MVTNCSKGVFRSASHEVVTVHICIYTKNRKQNQAHLELSGLCDHLQVRKAAPVAVGKNQADVCGEALCILVLATVQLFLVQGEKTTLNKKTRLCSQIPTSWCTSYFDGAEIHGVPDDVVLLVWLRGLRVRVVVEGPGGGCVLLGQQLLQDAAAVLQLRAPFTMWIHTLRAPPPKTLVSRWADSPQAPRGF